MLEKWITSVMKFPECKEPVLKFLDVPEGVVKLFMERSSCRLNYAEKAVATLLRKIVKIEKNGTKYLKTFASDFFQYNDLQLSTTCVGILLKTIVPLCSNPTVACAAIEILYKLLRIESYRYTDSIKQNLFNNIELLQQIKIEKHILNCFHSQTGLQGYSIAEIVKEHFERNNMSQFFNYVLNSNQEALEKFCIREKGTVTPSRNTILFKNFSNEWQWLNTENYSGGLKIAMRSNEDFFEVKAEIFIDVNYKTLSEYILRAEKRRMWDGYMADVKLVKKISEQRYLIWYSLKKDKKSTVDLALECHLSESPGHFVLLFQSVVCEEIPVGRKPRVECAQSYFEIQSLEAKVRRSSSTTDEIESDQESFGSCISNQLDLENEENKKSKLNLFYKMKPEMARYFVCDISEETSVLKESMNNLKKIVEREKFSRIFE